MLKDVKLTASYTYGGKGSIQIHMPVYEARKYLALLESYGNDLAPRWKHLKSILKQELDS